MKEKKQTVFPWDTAREMTESFAYACGVHTRLCDGEGNVLYEQNPAGEGCAFCRRLQKVTGRSFDCGAVHRRGIGEAERFGGRYVYSCPVGMVCFSAPIMTGGRVSGAFVCGPVLIVEEEEMLLDAAAGAVLPPEEWNRLWEELEPVPRMEPARLSRLSTQLFAGAVYVSDSAHELLRRQEDELRQNSIGAYIQQFKKEPLARLYPTETEHDMVDAISAGNFQSAAAFLNELLGYHFRYAADLDVLQSRMGELIAVMGRGALYSGADSERIFAICHRDTRRLRRMRTSREMARLLTESLKQLTELVYDLKGGSYQNILLHTIDYMRRNCAQKLTLEQVAEYAGYAPTYFSHLFKQEMGQGFRQFLGRLRIEKSKTLLLSTTESIAVICGMVGFEDQSYFCKVFRRYTGVTPDQYRKSRRRIDEARERDKLARRQNAAPRGD